MCVVLYVLLYTHVVVLTALLLLLSSLSLMYFRFPVLAGDAGERKDDDDDDRTLGIRTK